MDKEQEIYTSESRDTIHDHLTRRESKTVVNSFPMFSILGEEPQVELVKPIILQTDFRLAQGKILSPQPVLTQSRNCKSSTCKWTLVCI